MLSFRQKIFLSYVGVFFLFIVLLFPFMTRIVNDIVAKSMVDRADELIEILQEAPDNYSMVSTLRNMRHKIFFRVGLYDDDKKALYDSHAKQKFAPKLSKGYLIDHPEINDAYETGIGIYADYSDVSEQKMNYLARAFDFKGKTYVLRVAVPYQYIIDFTQNFEFGFLGLSTAVLLLFTFMTWFIINHLTAPIQHIINAIRPYQEGAHTSIPKISIKTTNPNDDFRRLANTLNILSEKIQTHIDTITYERNEKLAVLESLVEGVVATDRENKIVYLNKAAIKFLRTEEADLIGKDFSNTCFPQCTEMLQDSMLKNSVLTESLITKVDGKKIYYDFIATPKAASDGAVLVMQDHSSHHRIMEMRKDFIANASHELKTPITIIRGFAEALHDNPSLSVDMRTDITGKIVRNCKRMTNLIKDLLTLADIEHLSESRLAKCDLTHVIDDCLSILREAHPSAIIDTDINENEEYLIMADSRILELAIINLLENAAKYSTPPAQIHVGLKKDKDRIELLIADQGIGISEEDLENVFQRFYTVNKAHSQKMGGAGLGLSLVETIIEKHRGTIGVTSTLGVGTTFKISLPIYSAI